MRQVRHGMGPSHTCRLACPAQVEALRPLRLHSAGSPDCSTAPPTQLASLPESVINKARGGQQHYTIADLLCPHAHDDTVSSALPDEHSFVFLQDHSSVATAQSGSAASEARSLGSRKRTISSLDHIVEVIMFALIPLTYEGRPDIGEQLYRLLHSP